MVLVLAFGLLAGSVCLAEDSQSSAPDERVAFKVSYEAVGKTVSQVLGDLSTLTGVKLFAGKNDADWQVRDRKMTVSTKGVELAAIMNSIARVMSFDWQSATFDGKKAYRLYQDPEVLRKQEAVAAAKEQQKQDKLSAKRAAALDTYAALANMSPQQLESLRSQNPLLYRIGKSGLARDFAGFLHEAPEVRQALTTGQSMNLNGAQLSPTSQQALVRSIGTMRQMGRRFNPNADSEDSLGDMAANPNRLSIQVNPEMMQQGMMRAGPAAGAFLGGAAVMFDNKIVGMVPVFDTESEMAKLIGKAVDQLESNPGGGVEGLAGMQGEFVTAMAADTKKYSDTEASVPKPVDPELEKKIKLKSGSGLTDAQTALAKASGYCVVSDYFAAGTGFRGMFGNTPTTQATEKETTIRAALDDIETKYKYDWQRQATVIEFKDKDWYGKRQNELPLALIESWRQELKTTGTLNIDTLAIIGGLTQQQLAANVSSDPVLSASGVGGGGMRNRDILGFYAGLAQPQRIALFSAQGLDLRMLNQQQFGALQRLMRRDEEAIADPSVPLVMSARGTRAADGTGTYTFTMVTPARGEPFTWSITAPKYVPPKATGAKP